jgi:hypothetical protein
MEQNRIDELVAKYNEGLADPAEVQQLEKLIENGLVDLTSLRYLNKLDEQLVKIEPPQTSLAMDDKFYAMLREEKRKTASSFSFTMPSWSWLAPRLAFSFTLVVVGFGSGYLLSNKESDGKEVASLTKEIVELREMMMLSMIEKESATDRLKAVSLASDMDNVSQQVTTALFQTLNNDPNVNVRLAALEALLPYAKEPKVREKLVLSIAKQDSPIIQTSLAEIMVQLQEKTSVKELEKIIQDDKTPLDVKNRIKESINVLI